MVCETNYIFKCLKIPLKTLAKTNSGWKTGRWMHSGYAGFYGGYKYRLLSTDESIFGSLFLLSIMYKNIAGWYSWICEIYR